MSAVAAKARVDNVPVGIMLMVGATMLFAISNAIAKWGSEIYPPGEVIFFRSYATLLIVIVFVVSRRGLEVFRTSIPHAHVLRGLSQSVSQFFTVLALSMLPLAGATAISFSAPLFAACVAVLFLKEKPSPDRLIVLALGFVGVLLVAQPSVDMPLMGVAFALANAVMYGSVTVAVRGMSKTESVDTLLMWQVSTVAGFHCFLLFFGFTPPSAEHLAIFFACGAANAGAQYLWTRALSLAPATAVSPFYYMLLVWSAMLGFIVWGDVPGPGLLLGSCVIVASGVLLVFRESAAKARLRDAPVRP
ncbi:MAG: DMT family transporter [Beijerinckiaceae bacterium]|nr:DMT family transporter [Beijerinckiaceae bacterium]